jgi:hypothetical protein
MLSWIESFSRERGAFDTAGDELFALFVVEGVTEPSTFGKPTADRCPETGVVVPGENLRHVSGEAVKMRVIVERWTCCLHGEDSGEFALVDAECLR